MKKRSPSIRTTRSPSKGSQPFIAGSGQPGDARIPLARSQFAPSSAAGPFQSRRRAGRGGQPERAIVAFETALRFPPTCTMPTVISRHSTGRRGQSQESCLSSGEGAPKSCRRSRAPERCANNRTREAIRSSGDSETGGALDDSVERAPRSETAGRKNRARLSSLFRVCRAPARRS